MTLRRTRPIGVPRAFTPGKCTRRRRNPTRSTFASTRRAARRRTTWSSSALHCSSSAAAKRRAGPSSSSTKRFPTRPSTSAGRHSRGGAKRTVPDSSQDISTRGCATHRHTRKRQPRRCSHRYGSLRGAHGTARPLRAGASNRGRGLRRSGQPRIVPAGRPLGPRAGRVGSRPHRGPPLPPRIGRRSRAGEALAQGPRNHPPNPALARCAPCYRASGASTGRATRRCSPAGAGGRACFTCCWAISERIRRRRRSSASSGGAVSTGSPAWHRFAWRWSRQAAAPVCFARCFPASRDALIATLARWDQPWIDDPTNRDIRHDRPRLAAALAQLGTEGLSAKRLAKAAARAAGDRSALDELCTDLLAACALPSPAGFVILNLNVLRRAPLALAVRALGCVVTMVSGSAYPPRQDRLEHLARRLLDDGAKAKTLGGCRIVPQRDGRVVVCREAAGASTIQPINPGESALWDRRFVVSLGRSTGTGPFVVRRLGTDGLAQARAMARRDSMPLTTDDIPAPARPALPATIRP